MFKIGFFPHGAGTPPTIPISPNAGIGLNTLRISGGLAYIYSGFTVKVTGASLTSIVLEWSLISGINTPYIYFYVNYPGITNTGLTSIPALPPITTNTPTNVGFTQFRPGISSPISVALDDYITFVTFPSAAYTFGDANIATGAILDNPGGTILATIDMIKTVDN